MDGFTSGYWCCHRSRFYSMIVIKTLTLVREQLATLPVYFFLAYHAASLLNAWGVGSSAGQYYLELTINFDDICDNYKYEKTQELPSL